MIKPRSRVQRSKVQRLKNRRNRSDVVLKDRGEQPETSVQKPSEPLNLETFNPAIRN
jgi:hypothetical protein